MQQIPNTPLISEMVTKPARYLSPGLTNLAFDLSSASACVLGPEMVFVSVVLDLCQNNFMNLSFNMQTA